MYASPAVGQVAGGPPTVWVGSYTGTFYGLDARTGGVRWTRSLGGKISGAPTVIGDLVFVSSVNLKDTWALGANTGKTIWRTNRGGFNPAISDGRRIYFNGFTSLFGLDPHGVVYGKPGQAAGAAKKARRRAAQRRVNRRRARHVRYLRRVCRAASHVRRDAVRKRKLRAHHCWRFWAQQSRKRHKHR